ncbi:MAG: response regulator [Desulfobacterales bacterium]
MAKIKLMIADNHILVREGLKALLGKESGIRVAAEASDGDEMMKKIRETRPDVVLMEISMPELQAVEAICKIREISENTKVVILTMHQKQDYIREALNAGAMGYLLKTSRFEEVLAAIRAAYDNNYFLSTEINADIINNYLQKETRKPFMSTYDQLTRREQQIFRMVAEGATVNEIGDRLSISPKTVAKHRTNLMEKLNMKNTASMVRYALQLRIINPEDDFADMQTV